MSRRSGAGPFTAPPGAPGSGADRLARSDFPPCSAPWEEGTHTFADAPSGGATYRWAHFNRVPWRADKPPFTHLIRGHPGYLFSVAAPIAAPSEKNPWIEVPLNPILAQALVCGAADSLAISDEKGQLGEALTIASREMPTKRTSSRVEGGPQDFMPPSAPGLHGPAPTPRWPSQKRGHDFEVDGARR